MNFSRFYYITLLFFLFQIFPSQSISQNPNNGTECFANPHVSTISILSLDQPVNLKNFAQIGQGKLLIASDEQAWIFDGRNTEQLDLDGKPKICLSPQGEVFLAGIKQVVKLVPQINGLVKLINLPYSLDTPIDDIAITSTNEIYLSSDNKLWRVSDSITMIPLDSSKGTIKLYGNNKKLFYHKPNEGIFSIDKGNTTPSFVNGSDGYAFEPPVNIVEKNHYQIVFTSGYPWLVISNKNGFEPFGDVKHVLNSKRTKVKRGYFDNNEFIVLTDSEGVLFFNESGNLKDWFNQSTNHNIELVNDIIANTPNCFIALSHSAVHRFIRKELVGYYSVSNGLLFAPKDLVVFGNDLYYASNDGVLHASLAENHPHQLCFKKVRNIDDRIIRIVERNKMLIAVGAEGNYLIKNDKGNKLQNENYLLNNDQLPVYSAIGINDEMHSNPFAFSGVGYNDYIIPITQSDSLLAVVRYSMANPNLKTVWLGVGNKAGYQLKSYLGVILPTETPLKVQMSTDSTIWLATSTSLNYFTTTRKCQENSKPSVSLFSISFLADTKTIFIHKGYISNDSAEVNEKFRSPLRRLTINLSSMGFSEWSRDPEGMLFSTYIEGVDKEFSPWTQNNIREVNINRHGNYTIKAKTMDLVGNQSNEVTYSFSVQPRFYETRFAMFAFILLMLLGIYMVFRWRAYTHAKVRFMLESLINQRTEELVKEKEKTDNLLARVLPHDTASELKEKGKVNTQRFKMVTVLFSDIEGFTRITDETNPETLIDQLDKFFLYFDSVVEKYKIEKIKTIGDAYMCAGGIPEKNRTNPVEVILAALEMMLFMKNITSASSTRSKVWELRIGIDTGPVIAGVVGRSKLTYDIWGSTVNTASRMESSGEAGQINISGNTFMLVKDYFICTFRGKMPVKNKGDIQMYFVNGIKPSLSENMQGLKPNHDFFILLQLIRLGDLEDFILEKLEKGLPKNLYYHNLKHTVDVYTQVELIGRSENVSKEEMLILRTAALFHDAGHLIDYDTHEEMAVKLIKEILPEYQYTQRQIEMISQLIMATKMPPNPKNLMEEIMCDADLDYLGRPDFIPVSNTLYKELHEHGKIGTLAEWNELQIKFIDKHHYFTKTARRLRNVNKQSQLDKLKLWMENN